MQLVAALLSCLFIPSISAISSNIAEKEIPNLRDLIKWPDRHATPVLAKALEIIDSYSTGPTCSRLAAATLLESCDDANDPFIESTGHDRQSLEDVKSIAAVRLALCEVEKGSMMIPASCSPLLPTQTRKARKLSCHLPGMNCKRAPTGNLGYVTVTLSQAQECLNSLSDLPQAWNSYSNSMQSVQWMCHVARAEVEKEEALSLFRDLISLTGPIRNASRDALDLEVRLREILLATQKIFDLRQQFAAETKDEYDVIRTSFHRLYEDQALEYHSLFTAHETRLAEAFDASTTELHQFQKNIRATQELQNDFLVSLQAKTRLLLQKHVELDHSVQRNINSSDELGRSLQDIVAIANASDSQLQDLFGRLDIEARNMLAKQIEAAFLTERAAETTGRFSSLIDEQSVRIAAMVPGQNAFSKLTSAALIYLVAISFGSVGIAATIAAIYFLTLLCLDMLDRDSALTILRIISTNPLAIAGGALAASFSVTAAAISVVRYYRKDDRLCA